MFQLEKSLDRTSSRHLTRRELELIDINIIFVLNKLKKMIER